MAQSERLCRLAAERRVLVESAPAADVGGTLAGMQDRGAALSAAILDAEARISAVLRQKCDGQSARGAHPLISSFFAHRMQAIQVPALLEFP